MLTNYSWNIDYKIFSIKILNKNVKMTKSFTYYDLDKFKNFVTLLFTLNFKFINSYFIKK